MSNPNFDPVYSTWNIWRAGEQAQCLDDDLVDIETSLGTLETNISGKASLNHTHNNYLPLSGGTLTGNLTLNGTNLYANNIYMNANGSTTGFIYGKTPDGANVGNIQPVNENGNCVIGWGNYNNESGDTNLYGHNVRIYAVNSDGTLPSGTVFAARNNSNNTLINYNASLQPTKTSNTVIYGSAVLIRSNNDDFNVDGIQLGHTDSETITSFSSGWAIYASGTTPTVRRYGKVVDLSGTLKNTSEVTLNTSHIKIFTIPSGYRPSQEIAVVCQGSNANKFVIQVKTNGEVCFGRYGVSSFTEISSGAWFPFHVTYIMD